MKLAKLYLLLAIPFIIITSCDKEENSIPDTPDMGADYFIFGRYYGECLGSECVQIFLLQDGKLYEDTTDQYPGIGLLPYGGAYILLSDALYETVADVPAAVPAALYSDSINVFGCPDCHDQGGFLIQLQQDDTVQFFVIDTDTSAIPSYLYDITEMLQEKISAL